MTLADLANEVTGVLPGIPSPLALTYLQRAYTDVCRERLWNWLVTQTAIVCPPLLSTGTVSVTQFSDIITFDAVAEAFLAPYLAPGELMLTTLAFRTYGTGVTGGGLYRMVEVVSTGPLVVRLDRTIQSTTAAGIAYQIYRAYIQMPADFLRWESFDDYQNGYAITKDRLMRSTVEFDRRDPQRQSFGLAYFLGWYKALSTGEQLYELWPASIQGQTFVISYRRRGAKLAKTETLPQAFPEALLLNRVMGWYVYPWAQTNRGRVPTLAKTDFTNAITLEQHNYKENLITAKKDDDETGLQTVYSRGRGGNGPVSQGPADAKFWQSHPITWLLFLGIASSLVGWL